MSKCDCESKKKRLLFDYRVEESTEEGSGRWFSIRLGERECFEIRVWEGGPRPCLIIDFKLSAVQRQNRTPVQACACARIGITAWAL